MDRAWAPVAAAATGGIVLSLGAAWLPAVVGSAALLAGLVLMFVSVAWTAVLRESHLAPLVATATMIGTVAGFGATGLAGLGVLAAKAAYAWGALGLGVAGVVSLPWLLGDARQRATEAT